MKALAFPVVLMLGAGHAATADAARDALACFEAMQGHDQAGFQQCFDAFSQTCWSEGRDVLDRAPQTACLRGMEELVSERAGPLIAAGEADASAYGVLVKAAALKRAFTVAGAECDFLSEIGRRPEGEKEGRAFDHASCRAAHWAEAYWSIIVHGRVK